MNKNNIVRLNENCVAEGNILEHPIFKLSNKTARPNRGKDENGNILYAKEDYTSQYELKPGVRIVIEADFHHGYPTIFGMRVLLAVIQKSRSLGYPSRKVAITLDEIAQLIKLTHGGKQQSLIKKAIKALNGLRIIFENTWYDKATHATISNTGGEHLVTNFQLGKVGCCRQKQLEPYEYVELGERLFESLRAGYRIGVDLEYINELSTACAQRLYVYLTKKDGDGRLEYSESIVSLAKKLPLAATMPSDIIRILKPALQELQEQKKSGKQFIAAYRFSGSRKEMQVTIFFAATSLRERVRAMACQTA